MHAVKRVLYLTVLDVGYHTQVLQGVMRHARVKKWVVTPGCWAYTDPMKILENDRPDGVILNALQPEWTELLNQQGIPWVNIGYYPKIVPTVCAAMDSFARPAVEHLLSRGFNRFAFYGPWKAEFVVAREAAFKAELERRGLDCIVCGQMWETRPAEWVRSLPKPIAVQAANDDWAFQLIQACQEADVQVPDQVAVMGIDNSLLGLLCEPTLTSVYTCTDQIGERAAGLLDHLMAGGEPPRQPIYVDSVELIVRHSTDASGEVESDLAHAMRYIHDHARHRVTVADVLHAVCVSRRSLEQRFRTELGRGIHDEIRLARMEQVKHLLLTTDLPLSVIATEMDYGTAANLSMVFRKVVGTTPGEFRRRDHHPAGEVPGDRADGSEQA